MSIDVDAVNERLNGLVTLLRAVGIDSGDVGALAKTVGKGGGIADGVRQLDDDQIDAIIRKLQQAQEEAPQIIAALEAHAEARSLGGGNSSENRRAARPAAASRAPPPQQQTQEDESEEDDDEDEDANYPMVGHGVSDDISVVSDLTTPTVVHGANIPDEEHYKDTLPPMIIGGGPGHSFPMMLNPSKRKNLVSSVRPSAQTTTRRPAPPSVRPGPVSAAQLKRRPAPPPSAARAPADARQPTVRSSRPSSSAGSTGSGSNPSKSRTETTTGVKKKVLKKKVPTAAAAAAPPSRQVRPPPPEQSWPSDDGWNAFESGSRPKSKKNGAATVIDTDGFLVGDVNFDPFPAADSSGRPTRNAAGDLEVSQQARRKVPSKTRSRSPKPERNTREETFAQLRTKTPSSSESGRPRRSRRASLAM